MDDTLLVLLDESEGAITAPELIALNAAFFPGGELLEDEEFGPEAELVVLEEEH